MALERAFIVKHNLRSGKVVKELYMSEDNAMRRADELDAEGKMATVVLLEESSPSVPQRNGDPNG